MKRSGESAPGIAAEVTGLVDHTKQSADADIFVVALAPAQPITLLGSSAVVAHAWSPAA